MSKPIEEARLVDLSDDQLRELVGSLWEHIKRTDDAMKSDQHIEKLEAELKDYKEERYGITKREYKAKLRAARTHAEVRGLSIKLPEIK